MRFPYSPRRYQKTIISSMRRALGGDHLVLQSGTGSGKTVCVLYATLVEALERDKVVLHLLRTNSQQRQVMLELRRLGPYGLALQGRHRMCLLAREDGELSHGSPEELSHFCRDRKEATMEGRGEGCPYYEGLLAADLEELEAHSRQTLPTAEETVEHCRELGICPYELNKLLLSRAKLVTAPYIYFFAPSLRRNLLETMGRSLEDLIVVVDEAHNLPEYCREIASFSISLNAVERAEREVMDHGDLDLREDTSTFDLLEIVKGGMLELASEYVVDEDGFLPPFALEAVLLKALTATSSQLKGMLGSMAALGEVIRESRRRRGRLPRSLVLSTANNLLRWMTTEDVEFAKLVTGGENPALKAYCLDSSIAASPLLDCHASIHMSGTLEPLREYRDSLGLPEDSPLKRFPSPFPSENLRVVYLDGVTTRYEDRMTDPRVLERLKEEVRYLLTSCNRNTLVLFPSYEQLSSYEDIAKEARVPIHMEERGMDQAKLMRTLDAFRSSTSAFFAVAGGRVGEGLDFPNRELEVVAIVGIPYPKPTAALRALVNYYDWKFQRGWEYVVHAPATRRLLQSIGRLIRSETDRGIAIILDRRAVYFKRVLGPMDLVEDTWAAVEDHLGSETPLDSFPL